MGGNPLYQIHPMNVGLNAYNQGNNSMGTMSNINSSNQGMNMGLGMGMNASSMAFIGGMNANKNTNNSNVNHIGQINR